MSIALPEIGRPWRLALYGAKGMLARKIIELAPQDIEIKGYDLPEYDMTDSAQLSETLKAVRPDLILNCAAFTAVDACEEREEEARTINGVAVGSLAEKAAEYGALLVHISTDYVFDGKADKPYREDDPVGPLSAYGRTKLVGEQSILESDLERCLIVRTSWLYGPGGKNFVETILRLAAERHELKVVADQVGCPTFTGDLAQAVYALVSSVLKAEVEGRQGQFGIYHFSNSGQCSWYDLAFEAVARARDMGHTLAVTKIVPIGTKDYPLPAPRPAYSVFSKQKYAEETGQVVPRWQEGLQSYLEEELSCDAI